MKKKITIIAEVGVNHNGSLSLAKKYIRECAKLKIDYVYLTIYIRNKDKYNTTIQL